MFWIGIHGYAADNVSIYLQNPIVIKIGQNLGAGAADQLIAAHRLLDQRHDLPDIFLVQVADLLVLVRVDHRSHSAIAEDFGEECLVDISIKQMDSRHSVTTSLGGVLQFRKKPSRQIIFLIFQDFFQLRSHQVADPLPIQDQPIEGRKIDQLRGVQGGGHFESYQIGVHSKGPSFSVKTERRNDRHDLFVKEKLENFHVNPFDLTGELKIDSAHD